MKNKFNFLKDDVVVREINVELKFQPGDPVYFFDDGTPGICKSKISYIILRTVIRDIGAEEELQYYLIHSNLPHDGEQLYSRLEDIPVQDCSQYECEVEPPPALKRNPG
ncbi:MAG: hypothetical protein PHF86_08595 [Candidatus Nanoarchaeia archaeon]|jgi:hypothetical protein|nr:hypothetical protein [Candidatus Nanoarchaeia archaeon]